MDAKFYAEYFEIEDKHWWFQGRREILLASLDRHLPRHDGTRKILDIGCGTGTMLQYLGRYGLAEGTDSDPDAVHFCKQRGVASVTQRSELPLPYSANSFDLVTILDVLEHIDDDRAMLVEIQRLLRPGGMLMVTVPAYNFLWGPQDEISHHRRRYRSNEMRARLHDANFEVKYLSYFNTLLFPPIAFIRLARKALPKRGELKSDFTFARYGLLNKVLSRIFAFEARLLRKVSLPFGVSILALAVKR